MIPDRLMILVSSSSSIDTFVSVSIVGSSLTAPTVTVNVVDVVPLPLAVERLPSRPPSVTRTVIDVLPDASATGV